MARKKKPADSSLNKVRELLKQGKTLSTIEKENQKLSAAVRWLREHPDPAPSGAAPIVAVTCEIGDPFS